MRIRSIAAIFCAVALMTGCAPRKPPVTEFAPPEVLRGLGTTAEIEPSAYPESGEVTGTKSIGFHEIRVSGELIGCELAFNHVVVDSTLYPSRYVLIEGVLAYVFNKPKSIGLLLKVKTSEFIVHDGRINSRAFTPDTAYIVADGSTTIHHEFKKAQCSGAALCAWFGDMESILVGNATTGGFQIGYQRIAGGLDTIGTVRMPQVFNREYATIVSVAQCRLEVNAAVRKALSTP